MENSDLERKFKDFTSRWLGIFRAYKIEMSAELNGIKRELNEISYQKTREHSNKFWDSDVKSLLLGFYSLILTIVLILFIAQRIFYG